MTKTPKASTHPILIKGFVIVIAALSIFGCGSGSSSDTTGITEEQASTLGGLENPAEESSTKTGSFVDSAVSGIHYRTATYTGTTNDNGDFNYLPGEIIEFSIEHIVLGAAVADITVTPLELGTLTEDGIDYSHNHTDRTVNVLRFLQTFDADGYPENGISISNSTRSTIATLSPHFSITFNLPQAEFEAQPALIDLVQHSTSSGELVSPEEAIEHFKNTLEYLP